LYGEILAEWPWLRTVRIYCPFDGCDVPTWSPNSFLYNSEIVWHMFDHHVCTGEWTIEQLADWIATIEPKDAGLVEEKQAEVVENAEVTRCL
jgi:hypothetical protein